MSKLISLDQYRDEKFKRFGLVKDSLDHFAYNLGLDEKPFWVSLLKTQYEKEKIFFQHHPSEDINKILSFSPKKIFSGYEQESLLHLPNMEEDSLTIIERENISKYIFFSRLKLSKDNTLTARISQIMLSPQEITFRWLSREPFYRIFKENIVSNSYFENRDSISTLRGRENINKYLEQRGLLSFFENLGEKHNKPLNVLFPNST